MQELIPFAELIPATSLWRAKCGLNKCVDNAECMLCCLSVFSMHYGAACEHALAGNCACLRPTCASDMQGKLTTLLWTEHICCCSLVCPMCCSNPYTEGLWSRVCKPKACSISSLQAPCNLCIPCTSTVHPVHSFTLIQSLGITQDHTGSCKSLVLFGFEG